eukprot:343940-Chlamydomonas_euryale.AAC.8
MTAGFCARRCACAATAEGFQVLRRSAACRLLPISPPRLPLPSPTCSWRVPQPAGAPGRCVARRRVHRAGRRLRRGV